MTAETGNSFIRGITIVRIEIPTPNLGYLSTASSKKVCPGECRAGNVGPQNAESKSRAVKCRTMTGLDLKMKEQSDEKESVVGLLVYCTNRS